MNDYIEGNKKLKEFFVKNLGVTPEEFVEKSEPYLLKQALIAEMRVTPIHHYTVSKAVVLKKGVIIKLAEKSKDYKFYPFGYSNYFFIEIVDSQIINFGDLSVKMESFVEAVK